MGQLQERITSTRKGSVTSVQAIYVPGRRPHRPGAGLGVRPPQRDDDAVARDLREGHLPGGRPARLDLDDPQARHPRRGALQRRQRGQGDPAALQASCRTSSRSSASTSSPTRTSVTRAARAQDRALPVAAVPRRRAVHRHAGRVRADRRDDALVPGDPRRQARRPARVARSCSRARSTTSSRRPRRARRQWRARKFTGRGPHPRGRGLQRRGRDGLDADRASARSASWPTTSRCSAMLDPTELRLYKSRDRRRPLRAGRGLPAGGRRPRAGARRGGHRAPSELDAADLQRASSRQAEDELAERRGRHRGAARVAERDKRRWEAFLRIAETPRS